MLLVEVRIYRGDGTLMTTTLHQVAGKGKIGEYFPYPIADGDVLFDGYTLEPRLRTSAAPGTLVVR